MLIMQAIYVAIVLKMNNDLIRKVDGFLHRIYKCLPNDMLLYSDAFQHLLGIL